MSPKNMAKGVWWRYDKFVNLPVDNEFQLRILGVEAFAHLLLTQSLSSC
jgi:hypothetical protein